MQIHSLIPYGALGVTQVNGPEGDAQGALEADYDVRASNCDTGGSGGGGGGGRPGGPGGGGRPFDTVNPMGLAIAREVKSRNSDALFALPDVVGHGIGMDGTGAPVIEIYVVSNARRDARRPLPVDLEGIKVRVVETGVIRAF